MCVARCIESCSAGKPAEGGHDVPGPRRLQRLLLVARGPHATAHYALCTGFMALGMMVPGLWSGWLQEHLGYRLFFAWVILATLPSFLVARKIPLEPEFGKRN